MRAGRRGETLTHPGHPRHETAGTAEAPAVTISLVTYQGARWLPGCLRSLAAQTLADHEVLVIDNASTDGTVEQLLAAAQQDSRITVSASDRNLGFAAAHNRNIARARAAFVCLLNQDVELDERFLEAAIRPFARDRAIGSVQPRLRRLAADGTRTARLDSTGLELHRNRRVVARAQTLVDGPDHQRPGPVWGVDGPLPVYRRAALLDARLPRTGGGWEVLDEDFFMYKEDVDLAWRLHLLGWTAWYEPDALAWHARGAGGQPGRTLGQLVAADRTIPRWIKAISWRNHRLMQVKNEEPRAYLADLPWILPRELMSVAFMALVDPRRLRVIPDLLRALPAAMRKRRALWRSLAARRRRSP